MVAKLSFDTLRIVKQPLKKIRPNRIFLGSFPVFLFFRRTLLDLIWI